MRWGLLAALTFVLGLALSSGHVPGAWLIGALLAGIAFALSGSPATVNRHLHNAAQAMIGCSIAAVIEPELIVQSRGVLGWAVVNCITTMGAGVLTAFLVSRHSKVSFKDGLWGFMPAVAGAMIAMSEGRATDSRLVAVIQMLRLMCVLAVLSGFSAYLAVGTSIPSSAVASTSPLAILLVVSVVALAAIFNRISALPFIGSLLLGTGFAGMGFEMSLPPIFIVPAFVLVGWQVGLRFTPKVLQTASSNLPVIVLGTSVLIGAGLALSGVLIVFAGKDPMTAFLATVPGSLDSLSAIALQTQADLTFVLSLQVFRMFAVLLVTPILSRFL